MIDAISVVTRDPPKTLYHYTNSAGLLGIVQNCEIWCTHTQYLNDVTEFRHALTLFEDEIRERMKGASAQLGSQLETLSTSLENTEGMNVCVASFSEEEDSLSQWRAYGAGPGSFAVGFKADQIKLAAEERSWNLAPCVYDEPTQRALVSDALDYLVHQNDYNKTLAVLCGISPMLKHPAFASEKEWRIISRPVNSSDEFFCFRPGASMLVPYFRLKLALTPAAIPVTQIVVGPTPNPKQSLHSCGVFLAKYSLHAPVSISAAPYRSW